MDSHLLGQSSPNSPSEGQIERDIPLCVETFVQPRFHSETREMLSGTNALLSLSGCGARHNLHVNCPARGADQSDTGSMPGNARVSVNNPGWTVEPLGPHEPCCMDGTVDSTIILQSPEAPAGSAASPVWMRTMVSLSQPSLEDLRWWVPSTPHDRNSQDITPPPFDLTIRTDASLLGWGTTCGGTSTGRPWSVEEAEQHINCLELMAAIQALKAFLRVGIQPPTQSLGHHSPHHILLEMDNTTAIAYVNRRGGHSVSISVATSLGTVVLPADPGFMGDSPSDTRSVECGSRRGFNGIQHAHRVDASEGCLSGRSTPLLCSGDRSIRVAFEPSAASLCVATSRPQCFSSGCL